MVIVEDEPLARRRLRRLVTGVAGAEVVAEAVNGEEAAAIVRAAKPDVVFMDVQLPGGSGLRVAEALDRSTAVIFVTAFEEHAVRAFELEAIDYLVKPVRRKRLERALERARSAMARSGTRFPILFARTGSRVHRVDTEHVEFFEARGDYVAAWSSTRCCLLSTTLDRLEREAPAGEFLRIHRSYIVNLRWIAAVRPYAGDRLEIQLSSGRSLVSSRRRTSSVRSILRDR